MNLWNLLWLWPIIGSSSGLIDQYRNRSYFYGDSVFGWIWAILLGAVYGPLMTVIMIIDW